MLDRVQQNRDDHIHLQKSDEDALKTKEYVHEATIIAECFRKVLLQGEQNTEREFFIRIKPENDTKSASTRIMMDMLLVVAHKLDKVKDRVFHIS